MALGGGTFLTHNKILPGAYINFVSRPRALGSLGERGVAAFLLDLDWGKESEIFTVEAGDFQKDCLSIFGYNYTDDKMLYIRELFLGAKTLKIYRPKSGEKAKAVIDSLTVTALCGGERGNSIKVAVEQNIDDEALFDVITFIGSELNEVDTQAVADIKDLKPNSFVTFTGDGVPSEAAAVSLAGGTNKAVTGDDYSAFLGEIEADDFTTILYAGNDAVTKALFASFTKRLRDDEGYKITAVLHDYTKADHEGVISVKNTVENGDATALVYWVAGQTAGAAVNKSLTNRVYDGELIINTHYKKSEFVKAIQNGEFSFYGEKEKVKVLKDINTFTSLEPYKNSDFSNNQIIRVLDEIANGTARIFDDYYQGKVQNNDIGRTIFKAELINYHDTLQSIQAITNFSADDITVTKGVEKGDVVVDEFVEPVGAMDKLYMTVTVI